MVSTPPVAVKLVTLRLQSRAAAIMKKYSRVFSYIRQYKSEAFLYIFFIVLSIIFSLISMGTLLPLP
jgi:hypothetical protein